MLELAESLMVIASQHHRMSITQLAVFCYIAARPGCSSNDVCQHLGLAPGTVSRALSILAHQGYQGTKALNLIHKVQIGRHNELHLTAAGQRLVPLLVRSLNANTGTKG